MSPHSELALQKFMHDKSISLMAVQETGNWKPVDGFFTNQKIIRNKYINDQAGVAIVVDKNLNPEHLDTIEDDMIDAVWCQLKLKNRNVIVGSVYTKPSNNTDGLKQLLCHIKKVLLYKEAHNFSSVIVYGDFNARSTEWGDHAANKRGEMLEKFLQEESVTLCSPFEQTFSCTNGGSVIDLVLASGPIIDHFGHQWLEKEAELFTGAPARGHYPVLHQVVGPFVNSNVKTKCTDWKSADWSAWSNEIEDNVKLLNDGETKSRDGLDLWTSFLAILGEATRKNIPAKIVSVHSKPFWTKKLTELLETLVEVRKKHDRRSTPNNKICLDKEKDNFKAELTKAKNEWIRKRTESLNIKDSSVFWKKYKKIFGANQDNHIGNLISGNTLFTDDSDKETLMYETYFTGKHLLNQEMDTKHSEQMELEYKKIMEANCSENVNKSASPDNELNAEVTVMEIAEALEKQKVNDKCSDFNNIHPLALKKLGAGAISTLQAIFNWSLEHETWVWDTSFITFIRKQNKATYSKPDSYRPLSITSYIGKIFERILDKRMRTFVQMEGGFDVDQEGFIQGRSTTRYMFRLLANLTEIKRQKLACMILFIDFEKAYDSVHLPTLIVKLRKYGVCGKLLGLLHNMLFQRKVCIKVNKFLGKMRSCINFGLPQGSVIAPLLFILYISDMTDEMPYWLKKWMSCYKFADDGTFLITNENMHKCYRLTQRLCNDLAKWCKKNKLVINCDINKTEAVILKTGNKTSLHLPPELYINNIKIRYVKSTKVLGLILDEDLNFNMHAKEKYKECKKKWGLLTRSTNRNHGLNTYSLSLLLKVTVLTKLFYATPIWLQRNLSQFKGFWNSIIMKLTGATLNPHRSLSEIALHLPPLEVQAEILTAKFLSKVLTTGDTLTSVLLQIDGSLNREFYHQLTALKRFILWGDQTHQFSRLRNIELCDYRNMDLLHYSISTISQYQQYVWFENTVKHCMNSGSSTDNKVINIIDHIKSNGILLNQANSIIAHSTTKKEDSFILDYIHGNSLIFGKCRRNAFQEENCCYFCDYDDDSAEHQLFYCDELQDNAHVDFLAQFEAPTYLNSIIASKSKDFQPQKLFIDRVKDLIMKHDDMENSYSAWCVS